MGNFSILRIEKIKTSATASARLGHMRRTIDCPTADKSKENMNKKLIFNDDQLRNQEKTFSKIFKEKTSGQKIRKNAVRAIEVVMTFSPGAVKQEDLKDWTLTAASWIGQTFGKENVIDCRLHMDESTPHIQALIIPIDEKGRLNARSYLGGTRDRMVELQTASAKAVERFGLERGISKAITRAEHKSSLKWHAENARNENRLQTYEKIFGTEPEWDMDKFIAFKVASEQISKETASEHQITLSEPRKDVFER